MTHYSSQVWGGTDSFDKLNFDVAAMGQRWSGFGVAQSSGDGQRSGELRYKSLFLPFFSF